MIIDIFFSYPFTADRAGHHFFQVVRCLGIVEFGEVPTREGRRVWWLSGSGFMALRVRLVAAGLQGLRLTIGIVIMKSRRSSKYLGTYQQFSLDYMRITECESLYVSCNALKGIIRILSVTNSYRPVYSIIPSIDGCNKYTSCSVN